MLAPYRIIDLSDPEAWLCGQVLAQLGAEVIVVEPSGGRSCDHLHPHWRTAHLRGRVAIQGGESEIADLLTGADAVLVGRTPPVGIDELVAADPALIVVSVTPWGTTGPKTNWNATDLILAAAGGHAILQGDDDRPPIRISEPQAFHHAATEAVVHLIAALMERRRSGRGQHIDIAAQHCMLQASQSQLLSAAVGAEPPNRYAGGVRLADYRLRFLYPAADGHVAITFLFGDMIGPYTQRLIDWSHDEGHCDDEVRNLDYVRFFELMYAGELDPSMLDRAADAIGRLTATKTKAELLEAAAERDLLIAPAATTGDVLAFDQLDVSGFWEDAVSSEGQQIRQPGAWARCSGRPLRSLTPAPSPGADDDRIEVLGHRQREPLGEGPAEGGNPGERPLAGLRILDLSWVLAGPLATRLLADLGATVVRIETEARPDVIRASGPFLAGHDGGDATALWHNTAAGKLSLQLDIGTDAGREVALDLARWANLAFESFSTGVLDRLDLGFPVLSSVNPRLVMVSSTLMGQTGPRADFAGFGNLAAALAGFFDVTGWPDRPPAGPFTAYTDYVSPRFAAAVMLAAVDHASRTGAGQYVDVSQLAAAVHLLGPALLSRQLDPEPRTRAGNADPVLCPHGIYPCAGDDRWIAIAGDDATWPHLAARCELDDDAASWDRDRRRAEVDRIDAALARWTSSGDADTLTAELQQLGVAAHGVQHSAQIITDPQLRHRGTPVQVPHPRHGRVWVEGAQALWSRTQPGPAFAGPPVGQHTTDVLEGILGYDSQRIADLVLNGAIA